MNKYLSLREQYPEFLYKSFDIETLDDETRVTFHFEISSLSEFSPQWIFPVSARHIERGLLEVMAFSLGLTELVSYWKITCSPTVRVLCGHLTPEQIKWWKKLYFNGLGEFFHVNSIDADISEFMDIVACGKEFAAGIGENVPEGVLIPIGGGKDSAVTAELTARLGMPVCGYIINSRGATEETVRVAQIDAFRAKRTLDKRMLELNKEGFLNGHTPFSALVAFSSLIAARICRLRFVALSNESSANESTVAGKNVNHQYSKSFEFEKDFTEYEREFIGSGVKYFSFLRPLSEYKIAELFSRLPKYHEVFRSCNVGSKTDIWCGRCPKCLFVFLIMSPHISREKLIKIFGTDMSDDKDMLVDFQKLIGILPEKPFECVGSRDEINFAVCEAIKKLGTEKLPFLFEYYKSTPRFAEYSARKNPYNDFYDSENLLDERFDKLLKEACRNA